MERLKWRSRRYLPLSSVLFLPLSHFTSGTGRSRWLTALPARPLTSCSDAGTAELLTTSRSTCAPAPQRVFNLCRLRLGRGGNGWRACGVRLTCIHILGRLQLLILPSALESVGEEAFQKDVR